MLRPERMSRVSVTGSKGVMDDVIETVHDLNLLHVTEYDGGWTGFDPGDPIEGADEASDRLVTVRSLQSILEVEEDDARSSRIVTEEALEEELEEIRREVNELDDRRNDVEGELRNVEERIDQVDPFADLGIDLDLLSGYEELTVAVGQGDADDVRETLSRAPKVDTFEVFSGGGTVAVYAYPADAPLQDALVNANFTAIEVPDAEGSPEEYVSELEHRKQQLESELDDVEDELETLRHEVGGFLLAAEETLAIDVQKQEAPLTFATTENAFVAEGWLPTDRFVDLAEAVESAVGEHVELEELERRDYDADGHAHEEPTPGPGDEPVTAADGGEVRADGGDAAMSGGEPPVVQDNPDAVKPFELLTRVINRPKYSEFDPTVVLFLTFPLFFGFMIGDVGYGLLYVALGYWIYSSVDSDALASLGSIGMWAGGFTVLFGVLYGEIFGLHVLGDVIWGGNPPIHKGLQPHYGNYALLWLVISLLAGILHLTIGWVFDFIENLEHGFADAMFESGSWLMMLFGLWAWILADAPPTGKAPSLLVGAGSVFNGNPIALGFTSFADPVGFVGLAVFVVGVVLLVYGEPVEGIEFLNVLVNVLSYTRLAAVLLAKAGMAFVVNLLFFGVYVTGHGSEAEWHFATGHMPHVGEMAHGHEVTEIMFGGLIHSNIAGVLFGVVVLVLGHALVLALGITSAGLQGVRLEYVEFFGKFYEGGGEEFEPFGYVRQFTTRD